MQSPEFAGDSVSTPEVRDTARRIGLRLNAEEESSFREAACRMLRLVGTFVDDERRSEVASAESLSSPAGQVDMQAPDAGSAWTRRCRLTGSDSGLLQARTVSFKDTIAVQGIPFDFASAGLVRVTPEFSATVVERCLRAGATVLGKNRFTGFANREPPPPNPVDETRVAGDSSSGCAVAVALGEVDVAFGGDQGGSIRVPSAYCGIVGLKPTFGLISHFGVSYGFDATLDHVGPMARDVAGVSAALDAVAGFDGRDTRQGREIPLRMDTLGGLTDGIVGVRVGILSEGFAPPIDPGVRDRVQRVADVLTACGCRVAEVSVAEHGSAFDTYVLTAFGGTRNTYETNLYGCFPPVRFDPGMVDGFFELWRRHADAFPRWFRKERIISEIVHQRHGPRAYAMAQNRRARLAGAYDAALEEVDVLLMPTVRDVAPPRAAGGAGRSGVADDGFLADHWVADESVFNTLQSCLTGHPALAMPCGQVNGLPASVQLIGRKLEEGLLLRLGYALERAVIGRAPRSI